jgi:hypothetical protein
MKRITVQQFLFFGLYPWWMLHKSGIEPEELIIQICLCNKVEQLYSQPRKCKDVCDTIEQAAKDVRSLKRILVYYCGLEWPLWLCSERDVHFPSIVADCVSQQGTKLEAIVEDEDAQDSGEDDDFAVTLSSLSITSSQSQGPPDIDEVAPRPGSFRIVGDWYEAHTRGRDVIVDFIDSMELCGKECVRDRGHLTTLNNSPRTQNPSIKAGRSASFARRWRVAGPNYGQIIKSAYTS